MPIHDLGYRRWTGAQMPDWERALVITRTGVRRAWQSRWLRRVMFFAWLPAFWFSIGFFVWEQSMLNPQFRTLLNPFLASMPELADSRESLEMLFSQEPSQARRRVWAWLLQTLFRYPQAVIMLLVVGVISPSLISQDIRSRAFLLYFSRPLTRREYLLGKAATVWIYVALITTLPALVLFLLGLMLSPSLEVLETTWDLPLRVIAASAALMIPTSALALCISSLTQESRYASFAWFTIWILGWFTYGVMGFVETVANTPINANDWWSYLSLYHTLGRVQTYIFGFTEFADVQISAAILLCITVVSVVILFRRVSAPMRA